MPKLPLTTESEFGCDDRASRSYYAYTHGAVYWVTVTRGIKGNDVGCSSVRRFNREAYKSRKAELVGKGQTSDGTLAGLTASTFSGIISSGYIIDDLVNNRWIEIGIASTDPAKRRISAWSSELQFGTSAASKVGYGSPAMVADLDTESISPPTPEELKGAADSSALTIVARPRATYTDAARYTNTQGSVMLKVEFLASGTIGRIDVEKPLKNGLTESAVFAANRLVFLPPTYKGKPYTTTKKVEYSFTIY